MKLVSKCACTLLVLGAIILVVVLSCVRVADANDTHLVRFFTSIENFSALLVRNYTITCV